MNVQYEIAMKISDLFGGRWEDPKKYTITESEMREIWPYLNEKQKLRALKNHEFSLNFMREIHDDFIKENWDYLLFRNDCYKDDVLYKIPFIKEYKLKSKVENRWYTEYINWWEE